MAPLDGNRKEHRWRPLRRNPKDVFLYGNEGVSGNGLDVAKGGAGRNKNTYWVMIGKCC